MAKIEKHRALLNLDGIVAAADGVMVARGDLGVEIWLEEVPMVQKMLVEKCNRAGKPVIVANSPLPMERVREMVAEMRKLPHMLVEALR